MANLKRLSLETTTVNTQTSDNAHVITKDDFRKIEAFIQADIDSLPPNTEDKMTYRVILREAKNAILLFEYEAFVKSDASGKIVDAGSVGKFYIVPPILKDDLRLYCANKEPMVFNGNDIVFWIDHISGQTCFENDIFDEYIIDNGDRIFSDYAFLKDDAFIEDVVSLMNVAQSYVDDYFS